MDEDEARLRELEAFADEMDRELEAKLAQMAKDFDRMMYGAVCDAEGRAELLRWCAKPLHTPPKLAYPEGMVPIGMLKDWFRSELQRALVEAESLMRCCAHQYVRGDEVEADSKVH